MLAAFRAVVWQPWIDPAQKRAAAARHVQQAEKDALKAHSLSSNAAIASCAHHWIALGSLPAIFLKTACHR